MHVDKDSKGNVSMMELTPEETKDLGAILFEFQYLVGNAFLSDSEKARLLMLSQKIRFQIIDVLK